MGHRRTKINQYYDTAEDCRMRHHPFSKETISKQHLKGSEMLQISTELC